VCVVVGSGAVAAQTPAPPATNDPGTPRQWALERIGAPAAWQVATGEGTTIAVVDSGLDVGHPDLADKIDGTTDCVGHDEVTGGCVDGQGSDDAGHGTHVAGIAAASSDNGEGIAGVAPRARLLGVRVLTNRCPAGTAPTDGCEAEGVESDVAEGVRWAADRGADVINLSLGSVTQAAVGPGRVLADALAYAWDRGAIPVLVAGNDLLVPASLVDVPALVVSATDRDDLEASYANGVGAARWAVAAPGGESDTAASCESDTPNGILSTFHQDGASGYACIAGTSMAAPHVAGALAVLRSAGLGPQEAIDRLLATAVDLGPAGPDATFGAGRVDLAAAVAGVAPTGQPVRASGEPGTAATDVRPSATPGATTGPSTSAPTSAGSTPTSADTTVPPGSDRPAGRGGDDELAGDAASSRRDEPTSSTPSGPTTLAVLAIVAVGAAHAWRYLASSNLARRTPRR
jgi:subtilisin family serine protease